MRCREVQQWLSAYHDHELASVPRDEVREHVRACRQCAAELRGFEQLGALAAALPNIDPPANQWRMIHAALARPAWLQARRQPRRTWGVFCAAVVAVSILIGIVGVATVFQQYIVPRAHDHDVHLVANFGRFLDQFEQEPETAQECLCRDYRGRQVSVAEATQLVGYQPTPTRRLPPGYSVDKIYVLDMPCCRCSETIYRRDSGGLVAVFEHIDEKTNWFGKRPMTMATCHGAATGIVQMDHQLAVSWKKGRRRFTAVGVQDITEVVRLVKHFSDAT